MIYVLLLECDNYTYGLECKQICGNCSNRESCNHIDGICLHGCDSGLFGIMCDTGKGHQFLIIMFLNYVL